MKDQLVVARALFALVVLLALYHSQVWVDVFNTALALIR